MSKEHEDMLVLWGDRVSPTTRSREALLTQLHFHAAKDLYEICSMNMEIEEIQGTGVPWSFLNSLKDHLGAMLKKDIAERDVLLQISSLHDILREWLEKLLRTQRLVLRAQKELKKEPPLNRKRGNLGSHWNGFLYRRSGHESELTTADDRGWPSEEVSDARNLYRGKSHLD